MSEQAHMFGIVTLLSGEVTGITVSSFNQSEAAEAADVRGSDGKMVEKKAYSVSSSVALTGVIQAVSSGGSMVLPGAGAKVTWGGKDYLVDSVERPQEATAFCQVTINASISDAALVTPYVPEAASASSAGGQDNG